MLHGHTANNFIIGHGIIFASPLINGHRHLKIVQLHGMAICMLIKPPYMYLYGMYGRQMIWLIIKLGETSGCNFDQCESTVLVLAGKQHHALTTMTSAQIHWMDTVYGLSLPSTQTQC